MTLAIQGEQIAEHGGAEGVRDLGGLESALARPKNLLAYAKKKPSLAELAAAYAYGITRNHPFVDGNKRTALVVAETFLRLNGYRIEAPREEKYLMYHSLAQGTVSEKQLSIWYKKAMIPSKKDPTSAR